MPPGPRVTKEKLGQVPPHRYGSEYDLVNSVAQKLGIKFVNMNNVSRTSP
jgi:hypothetical protein